jgi:hypothetical protein
VIELETMRNQEFWVDPVRSDRLEQHRYGDGVHQPRGDGDIAVPQTLEMEINLFAVHADIGDGAARRHDFPAKLECGGNTNRLDRGVDPALAGHRHHSIGCVAVGAVDRLCCPELARHFETIVVEIDHDDLRW